MSVSGTDPARRDPGVGFRWAAGPWEYNRATQPKRQRWTLSVAGVTSPYNQPSFLIRNVRPSMIEQLPPFYEFGPFSVDAGKRLLLRNGEPVPLAPKVLETLLVLIENRERVLSKDELLKQVWGDTIVEEGGLTRNVSVLRKALGEKPEDHQYIVTVPARGYRFVAEVREGRGNGVSSDAHAAADSGARATVVETLGASLVRSGGGCARRGDAHVCATTGPSH